MPDSLGPNGLTVKTAAELTADIDTGLQGIYGADIQLDQNSPDGQMVGILTQLAVDIRELAVAVNSGFDPDQAEGAVLDQRVTINNIQRSGGTYTVQPIDITTNSTVTLQGLDANFSNPNGTGYTVQDSAGNQFILSTTATLTAGTTTVDFRAQKIGEVSVPVNTITSPVTIIPGILSVNNSSAPITVGQIQETDAQLRTRRQQSVANGSFGYLNGMQGKILALPGVTECKIYQNRTGSTDGNGIPAHTVWVVVAGGANSDIANVIYSTLNPGPDLKGTVTFSIPTPSGTLFVAKWDVPSPENLYVQFSIQTTVPGFTFDTASIKAYIVANLTYGIGAFAETSAITTAAIAGIAAQGGGGVPVLVQISLDGSTWTDFLAVATLASQWTLDPSRISITVLT